MDNGMKKEFSLSEIKNIAKEVLVRADGAHQNHATIIALSGDLGAGKTTLTQNIASELGVKENIISPTFVIMKSYFLPLPRGSGSVIRDEGVKLNTIHPSVSTRGQATNLLIRLSQGRKSFKKLIHIDAYRLDKDSELLNLGWEEIISNPDNLVLIEWPERVEKLIPKNAIRVNLSHKNEEIRAIDISI